DEPVVGLADLDLVDDDAWADALALIVADPRTRAALLHRSGNGPGYAGWWIARHARPGGRPFGAWRRPSATALAAACDPVPPDAETTYDETVADVIGLAADWADLAAAAPRELVRAWSDPDRTVPADAVPDFTAAVLDVLER